MTSFMQVYKEDITNKAKEVAAAIEAEQEAGKQIDSAEIPSMRDVTVKLANLAAAIYAVEEFEDIDLGGALEAISDLDPGESIN